MSAREEIAATTAGPFTCADLLYTPVVRLPGQPSGRTLGPDGARRHRQW